MNNENKTKKENLVWMDPQTGETFHAGVAFFENRHGEYRMILDAPRTVLYLKPKNSENDRINYEVLSPIEKNGRYVARVKVGNGYSDEGTLGHIYMKVGRYLPQRLVLMAEEAA